MFLVNIALGVLNVFTEGGIPRGQVLAHLHAGSIGWITLSVIATAFWAFTGRRAVSDSYARGASWLAWIALVVVAGYIASFYAAFSGAGPFWLMPLFGVPTALVIWAAFAYTLVEMRHQARVTTVHLLLSGGLFVASLAATMGVLQGLTYATNLFPYPSGPGVDPIGAHAGPMDMYLALVLAALVEFFVRPDDDARWSGWGMAQMGLGVAGGVAILAALYTGLEPLIPLATVAFLSSVAIYLVRMGWRPFTRNPFRSGRSAAVAWGGLAFPVYIAMFVGLVFLYFVPGRALPHALGVAFTHVTFVGAATNLILAAHSGYTPGRGGLSRVEAVGVWVLNLGLVAFIAGEFLAQRPDGALIMALGVLLALGAVAWRMIEAAPPAREAA